MQAATSIEYKVGEPVPGTKWVVRGKLGQGGMGLVLDVVKARLIQGAMKVLLPSFAKVPEFAARFLDEVKVTARLQHPNIVQVLDFDRLGDGTPYFVMERLRGRTLRAALGETRQRGVAWTAANTYAVAVQAAEGLYRAHSHVPSIVHRDVKPGNLFLHRAESSFESVVKVMDFGVAALVGARDRQSIGTPRYMAPEQVAGDRISPQTDQYALALVVYEMLTGRLPWDVNVRDLSALAEVRQRVAPAPASHFCPWLPAAMDAALLKALAKDPAARHDTVHGLMFELRGLQWLGDRPQGAADAHSTDPMMGTLADGGSVVDTNGPMSALRLEGPSHGAASETGASGVSVEFSEGWEGPPGHSTPESADRAEGRAFASPSGPPKTGDESTDSSAVTRVWEDREAADADPLETPMTGESGHLSEPWSRMKPSRRAVRGLALAALGSGALVAVLAAAESGGSLWRSRSKAAEPVESPAWSAGLPSSDRALAPANSGPETIAPPGAADSVVIPPLGPPPEAVIAKTATEPPDGGAGALGARKAALPSRPTARAVSAKALVPDDGRDELYVPGAR